MSASLKYAIPAAALEWQQEIKKSRFIVDIAHTPDVTAARDFVQQIKLRYPGANHHCSAFVAGSPSDSQCLGCSDDGEPSGTAGRPMLAVLQGSGVGEVCVVVTRFFGGIKLGSGGLVKAYGSSVSEALKHLVLTDKVLTREVVLQTDYAWHSWLQRQLLAVSASEIHEQFSENIQVRAQVPINLVAELADIVTNNSKGQVILLAPTDDGATK